MYFSCEMVMVFVLMVLFDFHPKYPANFTKVSSF